MADAVASPLEKLFTVRQTHMALGKAFDEAAWRREINRQYREKGWKTGLLDEDVANPEYIAASPEYARRVRLDDREAKAELEAAQRAARDQLVRADDASIRLAMAGSRIEELEAQIRELMHERPDPQLPDPAPASSAENAATIAGDRPAINWTKAMILQWAREHEIDVAESFGGTKNELLETVLAAADGVLPGDDLPNGGLDA